MGESAHHGPFRLGSSVRRQCWIVQSFEGNLPDEEGVAVFLYRVTAIGQLLISKVFIVHPHFDSLSGSMHVTGISMHLNL